VGTPGHHIRSPRHRDAGLRRITRLTRWVTSVSVLAAGGFSILAARAHAGVRTVRTAVPGSPAPAPGTAPVQSVPVQPVPVQPAATTATDPPATAPAPATAPTQATPVTTAAPPLTAPPHPPTTARAAPVTSSGSS
jgi:hypothetical protein